ncbi:hypothetical protein B0H34DRAFT_520363 [Crassisporium funariophilum]|nr:hypothetical protein B0H34DRAFT_520363 [Crassisporium funariophilum]
MLPTYVNACRRHRFYPGQFCATRVLCSVRIGRPCATDEGITRHHLPVDGVHFHRGWMMISKISRPVRVDTSRIPPYEFHEVKFKLMHPLPRNTPSTINLVVDFEGLDGTTVGYFSDLADPPLLDERFQKKAATILNKAAFTPFPVEFRQPDCAKTIHF